MKTKSENLLPKMLPGTVCAQMVRCGKPNCKCARGELHDAYYYHFTRVGGRLKKRYLKANEIEAIGAACVARQKSERAMRQQIRQSQLSVREIIARLRALQRDFI
jgi:hypothetical protein